MKILPIFIPHQGCPNNCVFCNQYKITKTENKIDFHQIEKLITQFCHNNPENSEIAFYGGTFTGINIKIQKRLLDLVSIYCPNNIKIRISTRPDYINKKILDFCKKNKVNTIELGIQSFHNKVLRESRRGYEVSKAIAACKLIKENKFRLGIQLMPGLPGFSKETLQQTIATTTKLKPEFVRIYPTIVLKNTELEAMYKKGCFKPLLLKDAIEITAQIITKLSKFNIKIIKSGLHSDIDSIVAGPYHNSFGEMVRSYLYEKKLQSKYKINHTLNISEKDISLFKGYKEHLLNKIKRFFNINQLPIKINSSLKKNQISINNENPSAYW